MDIILVDDGSTDKCGVICDEYAKIDSRIRVIHKENGGLSDARNAGIEICKGDYITFIDSDDVIAKDYIEILYNLILINNVSVSACSKIDFVETIPQVKVDDITIILSKKEALKSILCEEGFSTSAWGKLYDKKLFKDIRFPKGQVYEDLATIYKVLDRISQVALTYSVKYYYRYNPQSITNSTFSKKNLDIISSHESILDYVNKTFPELKKYARQRYARYLTAYLLRAIITRYDDKKDLIIMRHLLRKHIIPFLGSKYSFAKKIYSILLSCSLSFSKLITLIIFSKKYRCVFYK